jgi:hypothetical protein
VTRALTPTQAAELLRAASVLPPGRRDAFLAAVDTRLRTLPHRVTDEDVAGTIVAVLADTNITTTSHFLCDAVPTAVNDPYERYIWALKDIEITRPDDGDKSEGGIP